MRASVSRSAPPDVGAVTIVLPWFVLVSMLRTPA